MFELKSLYFNTAYLGPMPVRARERVEERLAQLMDPGQVDSDFLFDSADRVRCLFARLLNCPDSNVALSTSVSELVSHIANGLNLGVGDDVLLMEGDYPSLILPWLVLSEQRGFQVRRLKRDNFLSGDALAQALLKSTRFVGLSHVMFNTGAQMPIEELAQTCRSHGVLFLTDVSQSFGGMPLPQSWMRSVDIIVGVAYKWLLGPYGSAFGYFSDNALARVPRTHASWLTAPGWKTRENLLRYSTEALPGARKFDRGQQSSFLISAALEASLELLLEIGLDQIAERNRALVSYFCDNLPAAMQPLSEVTERSNIICLRPEGASSDPLHARLKQRQIDASIREGSLRLSFHLCNIRDQVDQLLAALRF